MTLCQAKGQKVTLRRHAGYDHSYQFVASFIEDHIAFHAKALRAKVVAQVFFVPSDTAGKPIRCKAAVAWKPNEPLKVHSPYH